MKLKNLESFKSWRSKRVFLRVDYNLPQKNGRIQDASRLLASLETIKYLEAKGARIIIASHWESQDAKALSTKALASRLAKELKSPVKFVPDLVGEKAQKAISNLKDGRIVFLENLRLDSGEKRNCSRFAKKLASLAEVYVNEAFSVSHRAHASVDKLSSLLPAFAGKQLEQELNNLNKILKPKKPFALIMGGAKMSDKLALLKNLHKKANYIILGGGLANTMLAKDGFEIGRSIKDTKSLGAINSLLKEKSFRKKLKLPIDLVVKTKSGKILNKLLKEIDKTDTIYDIGPASIAVFSNYIKKAETIVWNGPMGKYEESHFKHGSLILASAIAIRSKGRAFGLVGGGETLDVLKMSKLEEYIDWISTAGGAMLSYLSGADMPGLKNLFNK